MRGEDRVGSAHGDAGARSVAACQHGCAESPRIVALARNRHGDACEVEVCDVNIHLCLRGGRACMSVCVGGRACVW